MSFGQVSYVMFWFLVFFFISVDVASEYVDMTPKNIDMTPQNVDVFEVTSAFTDKRLKTKNTT